jgi:hypothetical protein
VQATAFAPSLAEAEALLSDAFAGLEALATASAPAQTVEVTLNKLEAEAAWVHGRRYAVDMCWVADSYERTAEICAEAIDGAPSPLSRIVFAWGFAPTGGPDVAQTALGTLTVNVYAIWEAPSNDRANEQWTAQAMLAMGPHISGFYAGEADLSVDADRKVRAYPPEKWARLAQIRDHYDPERIKFGFISEE